MAQQMTVTYLDDIDGTKAAETISFALDGAHYEIDVNAKNAKGLRKALAEFVEAARKVKTAEPVGRPARSKRTQTAAKTGNNDELAAIRAWAEENGIPVASRGRLSESLKEQYAAANGNLNS